MEYFQCFSNEMETIFDEGCTTWSSQTEMTQIVWLHWGSAEGYATLGGNKFVSIPA